MKRFSKFIQESTELGEKFRPPVTNPGIEVEKKNYSWGKMITVYDGARQSYPLHPEHQEKIRKLKHGQSTTFTDETRTKVTATRKGDTVHLQQHNSSSSTPVAHSHFTEEVNLDEASKEHLERLKSMLDKAKPGSADHSQIRHAISAQYGDEHIPAKHRNVKPDTYLEAVEVSHDRYMRSHGKKASGGEDVDLYESLFGGGKKIEDHHYTLINTNVNRRVGHGTVWKTKEGADRYHTQQKTHSKDAEAYKAPHMKVMTVGDAKKRGVPSHNFHNLAVSEDVDLDEAVEVSHDRYMRSHGKKARDSGQPGNWMFTHKRMGDANVNDPKEVHSARGKFSDAKKSAQQWAKKHGHSTVYVMEEVELDEVSDKKLDAYRQKAFADQPAGDDGSDKYRKRKFGRDLAFAKQTGRAKVLATKEEVEQIDEYPNFLGRRMRLMRNTKSSKAIVTKDDKPVAIYPDLKSAQKDYYGKDGHGIGMRSHSAAERIRKANPGIKIVESVEQIDELKVPSKLQKAKFWLAHGKTPRQAVSTEKSYAATKSSDSLKRLKIGRTSDNVYKKGETPRDDKSVIFGSPAHMQIKAIDRELKKRNEEVEQIDEISADLAHDVYKKRMAQAKAHVQQDNYSAARKAEKKAGETSLRMVKKILRREETKLDNGHAESTNESAEMSMSQRAALEIGRKLQMMAPKEKNDMISNAMANLGDHLESFGTAFGAKNMADLMKKTRLSKEVITMLIQRAQRQQ